MTKTVDRLLEEQIILNSKEKGFNEFIAFFLSTYKKYPYTSLITLLEQIDFSDISNYGMPFLASYIRYSDLSLLGSGKRDKDVKDKLLFLHRHIGTISHTYREFIWSNLIQTSDLKRWLPLLANYQIKELILKTKHVTSSLKSFLDSALNNRSEAYHNLSILTELYPYHNIDLNVVANFSQASLLKLLLIIKNNDELLSFEQLQKAFIKLEVLFSKITDDNIKFYQYMILDFLKNPDETISSVNELKLWNLKQKKKHIEWLEDKYDIIPLKEFFCHIFLGISYQEFKYQFPNIKKEDCLEYELLKELYEARFPLMVKEKLYFAFVKAKHIKSYFHRKKPLSSLTLEHSLSYLKDFTIMNHGEFAFLAAEVEKWQQGKQVKLKMISDVSFVKPQTSCLLAFDSAYLRAEETYECNHKKMTPKCIIAFDYVTCSELIIQKNLGLPLVVIDTEAYAKKGQEQLELYFETGNFELYLQRKEQLFNSVRHSAWQLSEYFSQETLYQDEIRLGDNMKLWEKEGVSKQFLIQRKKILEQIMKLNRKIEESKKNFHCKRIEKIV